MSRENLIIRGCVASHVEALCGSFSYRGDRMKADSFIQHGQWHLQYCHKHFYHVDSNLTGALMIKLSAVKGCLLTCDEDFCNGQVVRELNKALAAVISVAIFLLAKWYENYFYGSLEKDSECGEWFLPAWGLTLLYTRGLSINLFLCWGMSSKDSANNQHQQYFLIATEKVIGAHYEFLILVQ